MSGTKLTMRTIFLITAITCVLLMNSASVDAHTTNQVTSKSYTQSEGVTVKKHKHTNRMINIKLQQLTDNTGLTYFAGLVKQDDLIVDLAQLADILKEDFVTFRQGQQTRDHNQFHITIVNPYEFEALEPKQAELLKENIELSFNLLGLGRASKEKNQAYFVVAESLEGQKLRAKLGLKNKDFHVTVGFNQQDVYGVRKNLESLIK